VRANIMNDEITGMINSRDGLGFGLKASETVSIPIPSNDAGSTLIATMRSRRVSRAR
jgi:hypothetical protein